MKKLTHKEVTKMTSQQRSKMLNDLQDKACNTDYIAEPDKSDIIQSNIHILESKILHSEY